MCVSSRWLVLGNGKLGGWAGYTNESREEKLVLLVVGLYNLNNSIRTTPSTSPSTRSNPAMATHKRRKARIITDRPIESLNPSILGRDPKRALIPLQLWRGRARIKAWEMDECPAVDGVWICIPRHRGGGGGAGIEDCEAEEA